MELICQHTIRNPEMSRLYIGTEITSRAKKPRRLSTGTPVITGDIEVGEALDGVANADFTYQWYRTKRGTTTTTTNLGTSSTYTVLEADIAHRIRLTVSFTDDVGYPETKEAQASDAVIPNVEYYFVITDKRIGEPIGEPISGTRTVSTWVYLNDRPKARSAHGSSMHFWGVNNPTTPFNIPYTVSCEDGATSRWIEVQNVTFRARRYTNSFSL